MQAITKFAPQAEVHLIRNPEELLSSRIRHLKRLLASYVEYCERDRTHCGLQKQTPEGRRRSFGEYQGLLMSSRQ